MIQFVLLGIVLFVAVVLFIKVLQGFNKDSRLSGAEAWVLLGIVVMTCIVGGLVVTSIDTVEVGHAKLIVDPLSNTVSQPILGEQWIFKSPWSRTVDIYYAVTSTEMWTDNEAGTQGEYPAIHVLSNDGLDIEVDILIRYSLEPNAIVSLYRDFPDLRWEDRAISSVVREDVRDVIAEYTALQIIEQREMLSTRMTESIRSSLVEEPSLHNALVNLEIDLRDVDPPTGFKQAIEAKLTAEQQKIQAEFEKQRIIVLADANKQEAILKAEGFAQSKRIEANGTLDAINTILTINPDVDKEDITRLYMWLEGMKNLDIPVMIVATGEDGIPIIMNVPTGTTP